MQKWITVYDEWVVFADRTGDDDYDLQVGRFPTETEARAFSADYKKTKNIWCLVEPLGMGRNELVEA